MEIKEITHNKEKYMDILLLGDEQESMIYKYLFKGDLYGLFDDDLKTICLVTNENSTICEIKNLATYEKYQGNGYGNYMVKYIINAVKLRNSF